MFRQSISAIRAIELTVGLVLRIAFTVRLLLALVWVALFPPAASAEPAIPSLTGRLVDDARILSPAEEGDLDRLLAKIEQETGAQIVVATLPALGRYSIESWGLALGRAWKIGHAGRDDGVVIVLAPNDREVRIEVGYGLEGRIPDATAHRIIKAHMLPAARAGRYAEGLEATINALRRFILDPNARIEPEKRGVEIGQMGIIIILACVSFFILFAYLLSRSFRSQLNTSPMDRQSRDDDDGDFLSDSSSDSFSSSDRSSFSGGGGSFGGGGASGRW
jgi:uncharacterized protein